MAAWRIELSGIVQGVGFRPFVYNLAATHRLFGWVRNTSAGVEIQAEGSAEALAAFAEALRSQAPPLARIDHMSVTDAAPGGHECFAIQESAPLEGAYQLVSPDIATCADCLRELLDPTDRRHAYPFINCTNCGPRFTIIGDIPYDRPNTTMRHFRMCPACQAEYDNPRNRRFHAQPNACPTCGPHIWLLSSRGGPLQPTRPFADDAAPDAQQVIAQASQLLADGLVLALKGLGGFHLACDATNAAAVQRLRQRKARPHKPFAVMMASLAEVRRHCLVGDAEAQLLESSASPIVLLPWRQDSGVVSAVAPNNRYLGVMLPYTPLHHLLLRQVGRPLVMTSGNLSEEPIAKDNDEALRRLGSLADGFLLHNRGIYARYDDSVWCVPLPDRPQPLRRARGYAPSPVRLSFGLEPILACGTELKNTFCLTRDQYAFVSQHIGDMESAETLAHFEATTALYEHLFRAKPQALACDMHPDYLATRYAQDRSAREGLPLVPVQHHHAHIASCLADNDWPEDAGPVIGVALDGTGLGTDGTIWGGEFLIAGYRSFERYGHLEYLPLPGGEAAIHKPYRLALASVYHCLGYIPSLPSLERVPQQEMEVLIQMVRQNVNTPMTSSCGRLFDAVSALLGVCQEATYEAQAAVELEMVTGDLERAGRRAYPLPVQAEAMPRVVGLRDLFQGLVQDLAAGRSVAEISADFHRGVAHMIVRMCQLMRRDTGLHTVALSGGCFQNCQLLRLTVKALQVEGFDVLLHQQVPCNDGGVSLGQALVAHFALRGGG